MLYFEWNKYLATKLKMPITLAKAVPSSVIRTQSDKTNTLQPLKMTIINVDNM